MDVEHKNVAQINGTDTQVINNCDVDVTDDPRCRFSTRSESNKQSNKQKIVGHRYRGKDTVDLLVSIGPSGSGAYIWVPGERFLRKDLIDKYWDGCGKVSADDQSVSRSDTIGSRSVTGRVSLA